MPFETFRQDMHEDPQKIEIPMLPNGEPDFERIYKDPKLTSAWNGRAGRIVRERLEKRNETGEERVRQEAARRTEIITDQTPASGSGGNQPEVGEIASDRNMSDAELKAQAENTLTQWHPRMRMGDIIQQWRDAASRGNTDFLNEYFPGYTAKDVLRYADILTQVAIEQGKKSMIE